MIVFFRTNSVYSSNNIFTFACKVELRSYLFSSVRSTESFTRDFDRSFQHLELLLKVKLQEKTAYLEWEKPVQLQLAANNSVNFVPDLGQIAGCFFFHEMYCMVIFKERVKTDDFWLFFHYFEPEKSPWSFGYWNVSSDLQVTDILLALLTANCFTRNVTTAFTNVLEKVLNSADAGDKKLYIDLTVECDGYFWW